jgi:hypothetical protein
MKKKIQYTINLIKYKIKNNKTFIKKIINLKHKNQVENINT